MKVEFIKSAYTNQLLIDDVVTHSKDNISVQYTGMSKKYKKIEKKINKQIGQKLRLTHKTEKEYNCEGYYFGLSKDFDSDELYYFFSIVGKNQRYSAIPFGTIDEYTFEVIEDEYLYTEVSLSSGEKTIKRFA